jgi:hypothetical protein
MREEPVERSTAHYPLEPGNMQGGVLRMDALFWGNGPLPPLNLNI